LIYKERGDLIQAEKLYLQAVGILEELAPKSYEMSMALNNLGILNHLREDLDAAGEYFRRALLIAEKIAPDSPHVAALLGNLGGIAQEQGNLAMAREYFLRALSINEKGVPNSLDTAYALNKLGNLEQEQKEDREAKEHYERALRIEEIVAPRGASAAATLNHLGDLAVREGDWSRAETDYRRALEIRKKLSSKNIEYVESLASLASLLRHRGQVEEAAKLFAQALDALENQITALGGGEEISSNFRAKHIDYYKEYVDLLLQQKQPELAFQVFERLRARELLKILMNHIDFSKGEASPMLAQQRSLAADIAAKSTRRARLLGQEHAEDQIFNLDKEIRALEAHLEEINSEIRKSNPDYAALTQPQPLTVKEVQERLLDADTVLLEYDLGGERSHLWLVTPDSTTTYELPKRSEIEVAARKFREILTARNTMVKGQTDIDRLARAKKADAEYPAAAAELGRMLLSAVASRIGHKRLLIVSDGILQYIPFAALPIPNDTAAGESAALSPLIRDHEIVSLPSASVLGVLKQQTAGRAAAAKTVAVLADPVFDIKDQRVQTRQISSQKPKAAEPVRSGTDGALLSDHLSSSLMLRSASEIGVIKGEAPFPRLLFSRAEAEAILQGIPTSQSLKALDFEASRPTATSPELYNYRIVHFATHGLLNSEHPELSGLVLSLVNEQGKEQNGFLGLKDIYNLNLRADLVVLSACETGLGKEVQGEGLVGVARGFMYAGASSVVASLWKVDDLATAEFMKIFYKGMLNDKLRPAAALRRAQLAMSKRRSSPYFWAGFVLQGQP
jgi:CHAT domain-containing protein/Tfp pilus assembly protein PilF